ncbi:MAG: ABC transporter permease [Planctomycetes bacterium]|jgi:ABC-2 type transport system permease protein|nr:ABC transporter permease [Planctomycetota bacterium]
MRKIYKVAQREFNETVRTRTFLLGLLLIPVFIVGAMVLSSRFAPRPDAPRPPVRVRVTCPAAPLSEKIEDVFAEHNRSHASAWIAFEVQAVGDAAVQEQGKQDLRQGRLDAYVVLDGDLEGGKGAVQLFTYKPKPSQVDAIWAVERLLREAVINRRYEARGLDRKMLQEISNVPVRWAELGEGQGQERTQGRGQRMARMMVPFVFMYLIFLGIVGMGQHMISSIIEEKNSRIIEVLLSAVSPFELMAGKIAGLAAVGLTVMALWGVAAYGTARWQGMSIEMGSGLLVHGLIYYVLGFVLFSALLAGVGSICNTIKETQSLMMPIMLVFVIPLLAWPRLAQEPNGELARVLSYVPPATPMVMVLRLSSGTEIWMGEVVLTILVLIAGVLATMWAAAKVFRTGILMYGKRPGAREILRWLREK